MSGFYNHNPRPYGPITKKPRMGPRGPHIVGPGNPMHVEEDKNRLLSFKEFILNQSNDINEQDALKKYGEYKTEFTKRQIDKFFKEHQEEEWFKNKYRPTEIKKFEEATKKSKTRRKELYNTLIERKLTDEFTLDYNHNDNLSTFLENFSLLLEGASIEDVASGEARKVHGVSSIFIPSLHPSIDKAMVEEYASNHPGFLRVAVSEAQADKGFRRRAWITYKQIDQDSLKRLCWDFNAHKFNGQETKAIVNKEMSNRIRYTQFWFCHEKAARADIKNIVRLLAHFEGEDCPLLETVKEYSIEETNEEARILGVDEQNVTKFEFTQNDDLMKALDRIILYLRCVHSFDYYAATEYIGEDDMPQKIGIMFARPTLPSATFGESPHEIMREFTEAQKARIESFLDKPVLSEIEQKQLGKKNIEEEIENFIYQHTVEKSPGEKYICKLTKKRFTAPEFVRKHIFNRCSDKLDEVRAEAEFFNNYVSDLRRPM